MHLSARIALYAFVFAICVVLRTRAYSEPGANPPSSSAPSAATSVAQWAPVAPSSRGAESPSASTPDTSALAKKFAAKDEDDDGWHWLEMRYLLGVFIQDGHGLQSQAVDGKFNVKAPVTARGSERAYIVEPLTELRVRQSKHITHDIFLPVDIVTAASPDALDVVASASRVNAVFAAEVTSTYSTKVVDVSARYGVHIEEPFRSLDAGPSVTFHLFEDNTVLNLAAYFVADGFDPYAPDGTDLGFRSRTTFTTNVSFTQVLSPTTLLDLFASVTEQWGSLAQAWNSVIAHRAPEDMKPPYRIAEKFPDSRNRNAVAFRVSQHIPASNTTVKAAYRFYFDENKVFAHTGEVQIYQYIVPWFYFRLVGRLHTQTAPDFWVPFVQQPLPSDNGGLLGYSSDSDLEGFNAREIGMNLVLLRDNAPRSFRATDSFDLGYLHYQRTNGLTEDYVSFGYAKRFQ